MLFGDNKYQTDLRKEANSSWDEIYVGQDPMERYLSLIKDELKEFSAILDVGCGTGHVFESLHERNNQLSLSLYAVDASLPMLKIFKQKRSRFFNGTRVNLILASDTALPFSSDCFDIVLSRLADFKSSRIASVLRPGGVFIEYGLGSSDSKEIAHAFRESGIGIDHLAYLMIFSWRERRKNFSVPD